VPGLSRRDGAVISFRIRVAVALAVAVIAFGACDRSTIAPPGSSGGPSVLLVTTTTTVFADMVQQVGGSLVQATSLVPKGGDVHTFEPRPADVTTVAQSRLLVMNGLGLDD